MALEFGAVHDRVGHGHGAVFSDGVREDDAPRDQVVRDLGASAVLVWFISCVAWAYRADAAVTWDWNRDSLVVDDEVSGVVIALLIEGCEEPQLAANVFLAVDEVSQGAGDSWRWLVRNLTVSNGLTGFRVWNFELAVAVVREFLRQGHAEGFASLCSVWNVPLCRDLYFVIDTCLAAIFTVERHVDVGDGAWVSEIRCCLCWGDSNQGCRTQEHRQKQAT